MEKPMPEETEHILAIIKRGFLTILLSIVFLVFIVFILPGLTSPLLIGGDELLKGYFAPVYSGIALLCALVVMKRDNKQ